MKELEPHIPLPGNQDKTEVSIKRRQEIEYVLQGTIKPKKGHFVWEVNENTGDVKKAEFKKATAIFGASIPPDELVVKPNCIYIPALNSKNAIQKYLKDKNQSAYYHKEPPMNLSDTTF